MEHAIAVSNIECPAPEGQVLRIGAHERTGQLEDIESATRQFHGPDGEITAKIPRFTARELLPVGA
jgi:hypothetical protein